MLWKVCLEETAFAVDYLYDCMLQILHSNASFGSLGKIYNDFHFNNVPMDMMPKRLETHRKRLSDAIKLYTFLEITQRYGMQNFIRGGIDNTILENKSELKIKFEKKWSEDQRCCTEGCETCITRYISG